MRVVPKHDGGVELPLLATRARQTIFSIVEQLLQLGTAEPMDSLFP